MLTSSVAPEEVAGSIKFQQSRGINMAEQLVSRPGRAGVFTRMPWFGQRVLWIGASGSLLIAAALGITQYSTGNAQALPAASGARVTGTLKLVVPQIPGVPNST